MLILHRYLLREGLLGSVMTLLVLLGVVSALFLAELLAEAAQGQLPAASVLLLLLLRLPEAVMMVAPLALLTGLLLALGRFHEQSEITVIRAVGMGFGACFRPLFWLIGAWALALLLVSGWLAPLAVERTGHLMAEAARQAIVGGLEPGRFQRFDRGGLTVYVGAVDGSDGSLQNILIQHDDPDQPEVLSAATGRIWLDAADGSRYLSLLSGYQVQHGPDPASGPVREMRFERNDIRLPPPDVGGLGQPEMAAPLPVLWPPESPAERREWQWRLAPPLAVLVLGVLAIPLAYRSPRQGRWGSVVLALGLYLIYSNAIQAGLVMMEQRASPSGPGLWPVHAVLVFAAAWLWWHRRRTW